MAAALNTLKFSDSVLNVRSSYTIGGVTTSDPNVIIDSTIVADEGCGNVSIVTPGNETEITLRNGNGDDRLKLSTGGYYGGAITFAGFKVAESSGNFVIEDSCGNTIFQLVDNGSNQWGMYIFNGAAPAFFGVNCGMTQIWENDYQTPVFQACSGYITRLELPSLSALCFPNGAYIDVDPDTGYLRANCGLQ